MQTFIKLPFVIKIFVLSILSGRFTQVLLYIRLMPMHRYPMKVAFLLFVAWHVDRYTGLPPVVYKLRIILYEYAQASFRYFSNGTYWKKLLCQAAFFLSEVRMKKKRYLILRFSLENLIKYCFSYCVINFIIEIKHSEN